MTEKIGQFKVSNTSDYQYKNDNNVAKKDNMQEYWDSYIQDSAMISANAQPQFILADASQVKDNEDQALKQFTELNTSLNNAVDKASSATDLYNKATTDHYNEKDYVNAKAFYGQAVTAYSEALIGFEKVVTKAESIIAKNSDDKDFVVLLNRAKEYSVETKKNIEEAKINEKESEKKMKKVELKGNINAAYDIYSNGNALIEMGNKRLTAEKYLEADDLYKNAADEFTKASNLFEKVVAAYEKICEQYGCNENETKSLTTYKEMVDLSKKQIKQLEKSTIESQKE